MKKTLSSINFNKQMHLIALPIGIATASFFLTSTASAISLTTNTRSLDGSNNNLSNPSYGQLGINLTRQGTANYGDGISTLPNGPNVRDISNQVVNQPDLIFDERGQ